LSQAGTGRRACGRRALRAAVRVALRSGGADSLRVRGGVAVKPARSGTSTEPAWHRASERFPPRDEVGKGELAQEKGGVGRRDLARFAHPRPLANFPVGGLLR